MTRDEGATKCPYCNKWILVRYCESLDVWYESEKFDSPPSSGEPSISRARTRKGGSE